MTFESDSRLQEGLRSGSSEEIARIAMPGAGQLVEQRVHLGLGGDVDAAGRLVDDQDLGLQRQPARQHHLLLVAAREVAHGLVGARHADAELLAEALDQVALLALVDEDAPAHEAGPWRPRERLLRIASDRNSACCLRSSGTRPMPARIASIGERIATSRPSTRTRPRCNGSAPKMARASSVRPAPTRPARPTISPLRTSRSMSCSTTACGSRASRPRAMPSTSSATAPTRGAAAVGEQPLDLAADHHPDDAVDRDLADRRRPASRPSRSTVSRSQIRITSSSRWVTKTTAMPARLEPAHDREQPLHLLGPESAEVGSSMTTSFASIDSARAISTICCSATERSATSRRGSTSRPTSRRERPGPPVQLAPVDEAAPPRLAADEHVLRHRQRRDQVELLVDRDDAERLRRVRAVEPHLAPSKAIVPASGARRPPGS